MCTRTSTHTSIIRTLTYLPSYSPHHTRRAATSISLASVGSFLCYVIFCWEVSLELETSQTVFISAISYNTNHYDHNKSCPLSAYFFLSIHCGRMPVEWVPTHLKLYCVVFSDYGRCDKVSLSIYRNLQQTVHLFR